MIPEDFTVLSGGLQLAWQHYCCPNDAQAYPPLYTLTHHDVATTSMKKRYSGFSMLMWVIEDEFKGQGLWKQVFQFRIHIDARLLAQYLFAQKPRIHEANVMLDAGIHVCDVDTETKRSRARRTSQLRGRSLIKPYRDMRRKSNEESDANDGAN